jgi:hypothetical protein
VRRTTWVESNPYIKYSDKFCILKRHIKQAFQCGKLHPRCIENLIGIMHQANTQRKTEEEDTESQCELRLDEIQNLDFKVALGQLDCVTCMRTIDQRIMAKSISFYTDADAHESNLKRSIETYMIDVWTKVVSAVLHDFLCYGISVIAFIEDEFCVYRPHVLDMLQLQLTMTRDVYDQLSYSVKRADVELTHVLVLEHFVPHQDGTLKSPLRLLRDDLLMYQKHSEQHDSQVRKLSMRRIVVQVRWKLEPVLCVRVGMCMYCLAWDS